MNSKISHILALSGEAALFIEQGRIVFMINTPGGHRSRGDGFRIRTMAVNHGIDLVTAMSGATALIQAIAALRTGSLEPYALQVTGVEGRPSAPDDRSNP